MLVRRKALGSFSASVGACLALLVVIALARPASAAPVVVPTPVANALEGKGQGLCVVNAVSMSPATDFPQTAGLFNDGINTFLLTNKASWVQFVQRTIFDLSNNQDTGPKVSWGDFTNAMSPQCLTGGCGFFANDTTTSFASRFRGFLNVTAALANQPLHIGFYADDAVSLTFWDKAKIPYSVITEPPLIGRPTWRMTQEVQFAEAGIYPLEILYAQIAEHAALEMSFFVGTFTDFQRPANQVPIVSLASSGFKLFPASSFFQTLSGTPSFPNLDQCEQCDRQFAGEVGNNGCDGGYYCNEAALCAPCDTAVFCGPSCAPCGGMTPFCINENGKLECGQCRSDKDCRPGFSCDTETHTCGQCRDDADCPRGKECVSHSCVWCSETNKCAGNSCNCCPVGANGKQMQCVALDKGDPPECVECAKDADCTDGVNGVCDTLIGQCVPALAAHESTNCCGASCLQCPAEDKLCLPGPFGTACAACRNDMECPAGDFCIQGQCSPCTTARHCGPRCETCSGDTPFCNGATLADKAACVRCTEDAQCVGGKCDEATHECKPTCPMSCAPDTPFCDGQSCVACYADTQCPCNGTCDLTSFTCSTSCKGNADCLGDQHCQHADNGSGAQTCSPGALPDNVACGSTLASICSGQQQHRQPGRQPGARGRNRGALAPRALPPAPILAVDAAAAPGPREPPVRRRALVGAGVVALAALGGQAPASAQEKAFNAQVFRPAAGPRDMVMVQKSEIIGHLSPIIGLYTDLAFNPLNLIDTSTNNAIKAVTAQLTFTPTAGIGFFNWMDVTVAVPLIAYQTGDNLRDIGSEGSVASNAVGDMRHQARLGIPYLNRKDEVKSGFGMAVAGNVNLPTGNPAAFTGDGVVTGGPTLIMDYRFGIGLVIAANAGLWLRPSGEFLGFKLGDMASFGVGAEAYVLQRYGISIIGEVYGYPSLTKFPSSPSEVPAEVLLGIRWQSKWGLTVTTGGSFGAACGFGEPALRLFNYITWQPEKSREQEEINRILLKEDEQNQDPDGDGLIGDADRCPNAAGPPENRGCPDTDTDGDGIVDRLDECPDIPEGPHGKNGCPAAFVKGDEIVIVDQVHFATDKDIILPESMPVLAEVAQVLADNPEIRELRIEGHTDIRATDAYNMNLSQRRVNSVAKALTLNGIDAGAPRRQGLRPLRARLRRHRLPRPRRVALPHLPGDDVEEPPRRLPHRPPRRPAPEGHHRGPRRRLLRAAEQGDGAPQQHRRPAHADARPADQEACSRPASCPPPATTPASPSRATRSPTRACCRARGRRGRRRSRRPRRRLPRRWRLLRRSPVPVAPAPPPPAPPKPVAPAPPPLPPPRALPDKPRAPAPDAPDAPKTRPRFDTQD